MHLACRLCAVSSSDIHQLPKAALLWKQLHMVTFTNSYISLYIQMNFHVVLHDNTLPLKLHLLHVLKETC